MRATKHYLWNYLTICLWRGHVVSPQLTVAGRVPEDAATAGSDGLVWTSFMSDQHRLCDRCVRYIGRHR